MSDGRVVHLPDKNSVDEDFSKVVKINKNVALGFTGDPIPVLEVLEDLRKNNSVELLSLDRVKEIIISKLKILAINELGVKLIFTGKNKNKKFVIYQYDSRNNFKENQPIIVENGMIGKAYSGQNAFICTNIVNKNLNYNSWKNIDDIERDMENCIKDVAKIDETVNTNIFKVRIK